MLFFKISISANTFSPVNFNYILIISPGFNGRNVFERITLRYAFTQVTTAQYVPRPLTDTRMHYMYYITYSIRVSTDKRKLCPSRRYRCVRKSLSNLDLQTVPTAGVPTWLVVDRLATGWSKPRLPSTEH